MGPTHARKIAERLHLGDREEDGTPVIRHVRRVASMVPDEARAVAWLHEVLELTAVTEQELLMAGLTSDELRALRLLNRTTDSHSDRRYLAHLDLIAHATGDAGRLARIVKTADLKDRSLHPHVRRDGWSPPYSQALRLLPEALEDPNHARTAAVGQDTAGAPIGQGGFAPDGPNGEGTARHLHGHSTRPCGLQVVSAQKGTASMLIEDYGSIGDLRSAASVGRDGSVDWLCLPRGQDDAALALRPDAGRVFCVDGPGFGGLPCSTYRGQVVRLREPR